MKVTPDKSDWEFARAVRARFEGKPGAERIATEFAIAHLSALLSDRSPKTVLEFGAGIGTLTYALLNHPSGVEKLVSTESNAFCLEQLEINIPDGMKPRCQVVTDLEDLLEEPGTFDLVVFDGGFYDSREIQFMDKGSVCFIEGARRKTRQSVIEELERRGLSCRLDNHHRGYRYFALNRIKQYESGKSKWKFRWRKQRKGCWIGQVETANAPQMAG